MGVKVYVSGISGNKEVKKRQQRVLMILDSRNVEYSVVDITEPGKEPDRDFMQEKSTSLGATVSDTSPRHPLPPQLFNDEQYCGDYDQFDLANENDELEIFLKLAPSDNNKVSNAELIMGNGTGEPEVSEVESSEPQVDSSETAVTESNKNDINDTAETDEVVSTETEVVDSSDMPVENDEGDAEDNEAEGEDEGEAEAEAKEDA